MSVEIVHLIKTRLSRRGSGTAGDPVRIVTQYWRLDGELEFEIDPYEQRKKEEGK